MSASLTEGVASAEEGTVEAAFRRLTRALMWSDASAFDVARTSASLEGVKLQNRNCDEERYIASSFIV
jgi:hypothetical protein